MDGHGPLGERCAEVCGKAVIKCLQERLASCEDVAKVDDILKDAFKVAHKAGLNIYNEVPDEYWYPAGASWAELLKKANHPTDPVLKNWWVTRCVCHLLHSACKSSCPTSVNDILGPRRLLMDSVILSRLVFLCSSLPLPHKSTAAHAPITVAHEVRSCTSDVVGCHEPPKSITHVIYCGDFTWQSWGSAARRVWRHMHSCCGQRKQALGRTRGRQVRCEALAYSCPIYVRYI